MYLPDQRGGILWPRDVPESPAFRALPIPYKQRLDGYFERGEGQGVCIKMFEVRLIKKHVAGV